MSIFFNLIRFKQWTKNLFCFAGLIFVYKEIDTIPFITVFSTFVCFCLVSSSIYILNDIIDRDADSKHPKKKKRPIASGLIKIVPASLVALIFMVSSIIIAIKINNAVFLIIVLYISNNIFYNMFFKSSPLIDVLSISLGFILGHQSIEF